MLQQGPKRLTWRTAALPTLVLTAGCALFASAESTLPEHMVGHWAQAGEIQTALVHGDLEAAREPARWLAEHPEHPGLPQGVLSPVEDMRAFARSVLRAESIADAARCTAEMAAACGRCHQASDGGPKLDGASMPPSGPTSVQHMGRHLWAADRMWDGLVGPSDRMWQLGATALAEDPLFLDTGDTENHEVATLAKEVHALGVTARNQMPDSRAGLYGRLLVTCARCHALVGVGPGGSGAAFSMADPGPKHHRHR